MHLDVCILVRRGGMVPTFVPAWLYGANSCADKSTKASRIGSANIIMVSAVVHALTVPPSDVSSNLALGCVFALAFNVVSSMTYAYIPWLLTKGYKDAMSIAFATSADQALGGFDLSST